MEQTERKFAVLIDADNVSPKYIKYILDEVSDMGVATYKRIYGDWTDHTKRGWKETILEWSVNPIQQYSYTFGKNATDSAMIIDAMDILYSGKVQGFCLVSSDSDFTKLAQRLREAGMFVVGMGERKTPKPFVKACDTFKILEIIAQGKETVGSSVKEEINESVKEEITGLEEIQDAVEKVPQKEIEKQVTALIGASGGQVDNLSVIYEELKKRYPGFNVNQYGYSRLSSFIRSFSRFEIRDNVVRMLGK